MPSRKVSSRQAASRKVRIRRAAAGLGLFAVKPIAKRAYIASYRGRRISNKTAFEREWRYGAKYMFEINSRWTIDGSSRHNLGRYVNHGCRPNAEPVLSDGRYIYFRALRKIKPGEEITFDYGKEYFDCFIKASGCRCASCIKKRRLKRRAQRLKRARRLAREARLVQKAREARRVQKLREARKQQRALKRLQEFRDRQNREQQAPEREQRQAA